MTFNKLTAYTQKVADAADTIVGNAPLAKSIFDAAPEELRTYFNNLVDALKSTSSGDSGAKNIGITPINGLTGNDIQTALENIFANIQSGTDLMVYSSTIRLNKQITFPKPFSLPPIVTAIPVWQSGDTDLNQFGTFYAQNITNTGFQAQIVNANNASFANGYQLHVHWIAIGK